jgi:hypothetical protein
MVDAERFPASARRLLLIGLALALLACGGCGLGGGSRDVDETVDVKEPIPSVDTSEDIQETARAPQLTGVLPGDFPEDLPLYLPASLVEFGPGSVTLLSPHGRKKVQQGYEQILRDAGWSVGGEGAILDLQKAGKSARLVYAEGGPGTAYRIDY